MIHTVVIEIPASDLIGGNPEARPNDPSYWVRIVREAGVTRSNGPITVRIFERPT